MKRYTRLYALLVISAIVTFSIGGWFRFVAVIMVIIGTSCWLYEKKKLPKVAPIILLALLLIPSLSACNPMIMQHPQPVAIESVAPNATEGCVIAVASNGASAIYTFFSVPFSWVAVSLFGAGLPSLADCWYEFDANRMTLRVWYDCGLGVRSFTARDMNWITDQFNKGHCDQDGNLIPWVTFF